MLQGNKAGVSWGIPARDRFREVVRDELALDMYEKSGLEKFGDDVDGESKALPDSWRLRPDLQATVAAIGWFSKCTFKCIK